MIKEPGRTGPALLCAARAGYGALLLCAPGRMISLAAAHPAGPRAADVAQVLGVRHLLQAVATAAALAAAGPEAAPSSGVRPGPLPRAAAAPEAAPSSGVRPGLLLRAGAGLQAVRSFGLRPDPVLLAGAGADAVHAASMIGLAAGCRSYRRAVLSDVLLEAGFAAFGLMTARRLRESPSRR